MTGPLRSDDDCIDAAAARWTALVEGGEMTAEQHRELEAWLEADEAHRRCFARYQYVSLDATEKIAALADRLPEVAELRRPRSGRSGFAWIGQRLGLVAATAMIAWLALPLRRPAEESSAVVAVTTVSTVATERRSVTLADGSRAELNARTKVSADFQAGLRRIRMEKGEAIFAVEKDPARPFVVETPGGSIRVTGTVFNVRIAPGGKLEVTVLEGSVAVTARRETAVADAAFQLKPGEQIMVSRDDAQVRTLADPGLEQVVAWKEGRIVFEAEPLREVAARLAEFHGKVIEVNPEIAERRLGGVYALDNLASFFGALEDALPIKVVTRADGSFLVAARP